MLSDAYDWASKHKLELGALVAATAAVGIAGTLRAGLGAAKTEAAIGARTMTSAAEAESAGLAHTVSYLGKEPLTVSKNMEAAFGVKGSALQVGERSLSKEAEHFASFIRNHNIIPTEHGSKIVSSGIPARNRFYTWGIDKAGDATKHESFLAGILGHEVTHALEPARSVSIDPSRARLLADLGQAPPISQILAKGAGAGQDQAAVEFGKLVSGLQAEPPGLSQLLRALKSTN